MPAFLVALVLLVVTAAPIDLSFGARAVVVRGTVKDSASGAALAGAHVTITAAAGLPAYASITTGADGGYLARASVADTATRLVIRARVLGYRPVAIVAPITG